MTLNTQPRSTEQVSPAYSPQKQTKKWEQKHLLLVIALVCVVFWLASNQIREASWLPKVNEWLPFIGGLFFVGEKLFKLAQ